MSAMSVKEVVEASLHGFSSEELEAPVEDPPQMILAICGLIREQQGGSPSAEQPAMSVVDDGPAKVLTNREWEVMALLAKGKTNREIAELLDVGSKTIDTHRGHVMKKLKLRNNSELTRFAIKHGYAPL